MRKRETGRVERLAGERNRPQAVGPEDVALFAHEGVAAKPRLRPDLIALAGDEPYFEQRRPVERLHDAVVAHGFFSARVSWMRFLLHERRLIPHEVVAPRAG